MTRITVRGVLLAGLIVCGLGFPAATPRADATTPRVTTGDFSGSVTIGPHRKIFVECRGAGSPTVVLIAGKGNGADDWNQVLDPTDPARQDPLDEVSAGHGALHHSSTAVLPTIASTTRVCAYDRPDTRTTGPDRSTSRPQPHTVDLDVDDLHRLLTKIHAPRPYVLVAHSYGGFVAELYARTHPADVAGLVMVDAASSYVEHAATSEKLAVWDQTNRTTSPAQPEGVQVLDALARLDAAPPLRRLPAVVLSADKPFPTDQLPPGTADATVTFADWSAGQRLLAAALGARDVTSTNSGHNVYLYSPRLVVDAIREVVRTVRNTPITLTPVVQSVLAPPRWFLGDDGHFHLQYELLLTNTVALAADVTSIEVRDGHGRSVARFTGDRLTNAITLLGDDAQQTTHLPGSSVAVAWLDLTFATRRAIPTVLEHQVSIDVGPGLPVGPVITSTGRPIRTARTAAPEISPPLRGGRWVAIVGPHRRALQAVNGALHLGQRYAIDFSALLDAQGRTHVGDPDQSASYFDYGQPVLAVGDAAVVEAVDGLPEQVPNHKTPVPLAQADGNHVILRVGSGAFVAYAHLRTGTVRVKAGQRVRSGQVLGELGNSGESGGPHLHFQMMNRPSILDADGVPFVLRRFDLEGFTPSLDAFLQADLAGSPVPVDTTTTGTRRGQGLTGLEVLRFPHANGDTARGSGRQGH